MNRPDPLTVWVIYRFPSDYPKHYVVRESQADIGSVRMRPIACLCDSLDEARSVIPAGLHRLDRWPADDPVILETWI